MKSSAALRINAIDNVAVSLEKIEPGSVVTVRTGEESSSIMAVDEIPFGFKIIPERALGV